MLGYDYPLLGVLWSIVWVFLWLAWLLWLFRIFGDIFDSRDMGGTAKAMWSIFVVVLPIVGVLIYMIVRGDGMAERSDRASTHGTADELAKLADLKAQGLITEDEFTQQKSKLLV
jgi:uncharacterized membrane protein